MFGQLKIYNNLTQKKEAFNPDKKSVGIYVCGVTPYDITHLGHAFTYVFFDVVVRYLEFLGLKVTYIQNVTDIDDDILKKAKEVGTNWKVLAESNFANFLNDLKWLNIRQPDFYPRATDHIKEIIDINKILLQKGFAYEIKGNVYFNIKKDPSYGKLSKLSFTKMLPISQERGNDPQDPNKINPLDFVLWQKYKEGEPYWNSPWGKGRPGWHVECSAMSMKYLGETFDIHGGGGDLIYPHHESEIAQSENANSKQFVNFWMHTAMLYYQGKKMSKSLRNMVFIKDLRKKYSANTVRLLLLSHHYRKEWEFTNELLNQAENLSQTFKKVWYLELGRSGELPVDSYKEIFFSALNDDFDTQTAIAVLKNLAEKILSLKRENVNKAKAFINTAFNILGLTIEY